MTDATWKWASLDSKGLELVQETEADPRCRRGAGLRGGRSRYRRQHPEGPAAGAARSQPAGVSAGRGAAARRRRGRVPARVANRPRTGRSRAIRPRMATQRLDRERPYPPVDSGDGDTAGETPGRPARPRAAHGPAGDPHGAWPGPSAARPRQPALVLALGFLVLIAIGTGLLMLPPSATSGEWTNPVTALFTATSAVCVTGLVVVDTATYWSPFGQVVILGLIQVGGFGFMTGSTLLLLLLVGRRTGAHGPDPGPGVRRGA